MMEASFMDLSMFSIGEVEEEGKKYLFRLDKDLKELNDQRKNQEEYCEELRKNIMKHEKVLENMNDDIHILEELKHKLSSIPEYLDNEVEKFSELDMLIEKKRHTYFELKDSHNNIYDKVINSRETLSVLQERLEEAKQDLEEYKEKLAIYDKWITVLINRAKTLLTKINEMDEDLKATILQSTDVSDPVILNLKVVVDYKRFHIDRKVTWYNDTRATLDNTRERCVLINEFIENEKEKIANFENQIFDEIVALEKLELEENSIRTLFEKTETQWNQYMEMQETYNRKEKLRTTEDLLYIHWNAYCAIQKEENINRNELFSQSLNLSMLESNITFILAKRDEIEAEIALRLSADTAGTTDTAGTADTADTQ